MKTIVSAALVAATFSFALPQTLTAHNTENRYTMLQEKEVKYAEIKVTEVPESVANALAKDYAGYTTEKAFKGDDGTFKVVISKDEMKKTLFYNEKGELLKVEDPNAPK